MVQSVMYYAMEAITRFIVSVALWLHERLSRRPVVEEKPKVEKPTYQGPGFYLVKDSQGRNVLQWVGRATKLSIAIPHVDDLLSYPVPREHLIRVDKPNVRLYFTFAEAASKDWFKEIEALAEIAEKTSKKKEVAA